MSEPLPYAAPEASPRSSPQSLLGCLGRLVLLGAVGYAGVWLLYYFSVMSTTVSVTIENRSHGTIQSTELDVYARGNASPLLKLGDIAPGKTASGSARFNADYGPSHTRLTVGGTAFDEQNPFMLLTDNGPFEYTFTFYDDHVHVDAYAGSKGSTQRDFPLLR